MLSQKKHCQRYNGPQGWVFSVQFGTLNAMSGHGFDKKKEMIQLKSSPCPQGLHWGWVGSSIFHARPFASGTGKKSSVLSMWERVGGYSYTFFWQWIEIEVLTKFLAIHLNLVRRSTAMPPVEPPKIVFTIAKATMPPSPSWDMLPYTWIGGNQS